ncbi:MAG TPA: DUF6328 family protein [Thermoanaerobaculia bacterium]|nr:DUF6328 family protein [Thermoanaerobaculia bacterium]
MNEREELSLNDAAGRLLDECRMVLPGIQALFGFQLIAVFNTRFNEALGAGERQVHLVATLLVVVAIALVMSPAAWHRLIDPRSVSAQFIRVSSWLLLATMPTLAAAIALEVHVVSRMILGDSMYALALAVLAFVMLIGMWIVVPLGLRSRLR